MREEEKECEGVAEQQKDQERRNRVKDLLVCHPPRKEEWGRP